MIDEYVPCEDILSQINAAKFALHKAGQVVWKGAHHYNATNVPWKPRQPAISATKPSPVQYGTESAYLSTQVSTILKKHFPILVQAEAKVWHPQVQEIT